jgi:hypothetical protein
MARLAARPRRRRLPNAAAVDPSPGLEHHARAAMRELRAGGVRVERAPEEALEDFIASRPPPPEPHRPRGRGHRSRRDRAHAWLLEPDRP